jgi:hypothetical protein
MHNFTLLAGEAGNAASRRQHQCDQQKQELPDVHISSNW